MYKITNHHNLPRTNSIKPEFFFNNYKVEKDFFNNPIFLDLTQAKKITKGKNEKEVTDNDLVICVRHSEKLSAYYTLPSVFILKEDYKKCQILIRNFLKENVYNKIFKKHETRVIKIFDELKIRNIDYKKYKNTIIDFVINLDNQNMPSYDNDIFMHTITQINENEQKPSDLMREYCNNYENKDTLKEELKKSKEFQSLKKQVREKEKELKLKEKQNKEKAYKEYIEFNNKKENFVNEAKELLLKEKTIIFSLLSNHSKKEVLAKFRSTLLLKLTKKRGYKKVIKEHVDNFFNIKNEYIEYLKENKPQINGFNFSEIQHSEDYNTLISRINKHLEEVISKFIFNDKNLIFETKYMKVKGISLRINVVLDKKLYSISDLEEIKQYTEEKNLYSITKQIIQEESNIKDKEYINSLLKIHNDEIDSYYKRKIIEINITNTENYKNIIFDNIKKHVVLKTINPNKELYIKSYNIKQSNVFKVYKDLFPKARKRNREILYYAGKTNSGKTYQAFEELKNYKNGVYLAPLRLLAVEGKEEIEKRGLSCSLMTGEERIIVENANFTSCTIEMLDVNKEYDVAIIDEIQMIDDYDRGDAWLQALVGVNAKKIIIVGSQEVKPLVYRMAKYLKEPLEYKEFERKSPLKMGNVISKRTKLDKHSAVIAFSKRELFDLKDMYESLGNKVSIIYGKLPPDVKIKESEKFRKGETDVLVSTDAIGMGLNLPIKQLYFNSIEKYNGAYMDELDISLVKQIAGRAGRYGKFEEGIVASFNKRDNDYISTCLKQNISVDHLSFESKINLPIFEELLRINKNRDIKEIVNLSKFASFDIANVKNHELYESIANIINKYESKLTNLDIVKLLNAPINNHKNDIYFKAFQVILKEFMKSKKMTTETLNVLIDKTDPFNDEEQYKILDLLHFFVFNFACEEHLDKFLNKKKKELSKSIMRNLINNINEDDIDYYFGYY